jgi:hypothetical protein
MDSIGSSRRYALHVFQNFGLGPFRQILTPEAMAEAARQAGCAPRRNRPLIPEVVTWLMMYVSLKTTSMTQGLQSAWGLVQTVCPHLPHACVTEEAFCQARSRLTVRFWRQLWMHLAQRYETRFRGSLLWKNTLRVLAVDGTDVDLPRVPALTRFFKTPCNGKGRGRRPQAKLVGLCSVFTGFCFAFKLLGKAFTEHDALQHLMRHFRDNDLVLMDCGFFSLRGHLEDSTTRGPLPHAAVLARGRLRKETAAHRRTRVDRRVPPVLGYPTENPRSP